MADVSSSRHARGEEHEAGGYASLTCDRVAELAWLDRKPAKIAIKHEGDLDHDRDSDHEPVRLLRRNRELLHPQAVRRTPDRRDRRSQTPAATVSWPAMQSFGGEAAADTQMGVSSTHVVVTTRTHVAFYDKAGVPQGSPINTADFFKPLGLDTAFGISTYFDARSIFDSYRKRFWVGSLAIKYFPGAKGVPDDNLTKFAVAVSSTQNPLDPWHMYWWDAVAHDGVKNDAVFKPGDWADYPILGVDKKCLYQVNAVNGKTRAYGHVVLYPADHMAAGNPGLSGWQFWDLQAPDGSEPGLITPAVHHGNNSRAFFAGPTFGSDKLLVWGLRDPLGPNQLMQRAEVKISTLGGARDAPQSGSKELIKMTNLGTQPLRASCRDNVLSLTLNDSADWQGNGTAIQSNRFVQIDMSSFPSLPAAGQPGFRERVFGLNNTIEDAPSSVFSYGWPVVETNADGDVVIAYVRTGATIDPEIRFTVWMHGEADVRPSRQLKAGEKPYKLGWASPGPLPWADTGGISVDPFDDNAVWFAHCYADSHASDGNYAIWVGKVLGKRRPWLKTRVQALAVRRLSPGDPIELRVSIANAGDGESPATHAVVHLVGEDGDDRIRIARLGVPPLAPGATAQIEVPVRTPEQLSDGTYELEVAVHLDERIRQYDPTTSTGRCPTPVKVRC
jgi:hypothetical protein